MWQCYNSLEIRNITAEEVDHAGTKHKAGEHREQACNPCNKRTHFKQRDAYTSYIA
jgi:hypothetical protein